MIAVLKQNATEKQIEMIKKLAKEKGKTIDEELLNKLTMKKASDTIDYLNKLEVPENE